MTSKCWNCDMAIEDKDRYCKYCGKEQKNNDNFCFEYLNTNCWKCNFKIERKDKYCKNCGAGQNKFSKFFYTTPGIIILAIFLGPLVFFRLWKSKLISKNTKIILTFLITFFMIFIFLGIANALSTIMNAYSGTNYDF